MDIFTPSNWIFSFIQLNLNETWTISRNSSQIKTNLIIEYKGPQSIFLSEAAPNIRYGETKDLLEKEILEFQKMLSQESHHHTNQLLEDIQKFSNAFRFAISSIIHQVIAFEQSQTLHEYLNLEIAKDVATSFSIPMLKSEKEIIEYIQKYNVQQYQSVKIKIKNHLEIDKVKLIAKQLPNKIRIDANEGLQSLEEWNLFIKGVEKINQIEFIEQPFSEDQINLYRQIKSSSPFPIILDESIKDQKITNEMVEICHGINIKLMKSADLVFAKDQLLTAKSLGLQTMIGCMIESSIGISLAMHLATLCDYHDLDGHLLISNDPYARLNMENGLLNFTR